MRNHGAKGDGIADDTAAVQAALNAAATQGKATVHFPSGIYKLSALTIPPGIVKGVAFEGEGGGADRKPELRFTGSGGLNFRNFGGYVRLARLQINHARASAAGNGVGIHLGDCYYVDLEDLWVTQFDINIQQTGNCIYSQWHGVRSLYGYSACVKWNGALQNGNWFENCQFSGSTNGTGLLVADARGSAAVTLRSVKCEDNKKYGFYQTATGFINIQFDAFYAENNGLEDVYVENQYPHAASLVSFDNCYFDPNNRGRYAPHRRVVVKGSRVELRNSKFYQMDARAEDDPPDMTPPVHVIDKRGTEPCIAINNDYGNVSFTDDEAGWIIMDSKHAFVNFAPANPATLGYHAIKAGSFVFNTDESTLGRTLGWLAESSGRGAAANPPLTATTTAGSSLISTSDSQYPLTAGDYVQVAGARFDRRARTGGSAADDYAMILEVRVGPAILLDGTANGAVAGAAVTYRAAGIAAVPRMSRSLENVRVENNGAAAFDLGGEGHALFMISETGALGASALVMATKGTLSIAFQNGTRYTLAKGTANRINLSLAGATVAVENRTGSANRYSAVQLSVY